MPGLSPKDLLARQTMLTDPNILAIKGDHSIKRKVAVFSNPKS
jgi:hypothetical protein